MKNNLNPAGLKVEWLFLSLALKNFYFDIFFFQIFMLTARILSILLKNKLAIINDVISKIKIVLSFKVTKKVENKFGVKFGLYPEITPLLMEIYFYKQYSRMNNFIPKRGWVVIDCGATAGEFSIYAASKCARCFAIEPYPLHFKELKRNIKLNSLDKKITPLNIAVSSKVSKTLIKNGNKCFFSKTTTLDNLIKKYHVKSVELIKIDVEGYEFEVLKGAKTIIEKFRPKIIAEIHSKELFRKIIKLLFPLGYEIAFQKSWAYRTPEMDRIVVTYFEPKPEKR